MKTFFTKTFTFLLPLFFCTATLFASEGAEHAPLGIDAKFVFTIINFILLFTGLFYFLRKPAAEFFSTRAISTKLEIEKSQKLRDETYRHLEEIEGKLKNVDIEGKELIQSVKNQSEKEKQSMIAEAQEMSKKIKSDTERLAHHELLKAKKELQTQAVKLASELATKKIKEQITSEDHIKLGSDFITQIKKVNIS